MNMAPDVLTTATGSALIPQDLAGAEPVRPGIYLVEPHGRLIAESKKSMIVKSRRFTKYSGVPLYVVQGSAVWALINMQDPRVISLEEFRALGRRHRITEENREKWWPRAKTLYAYEFQLLNTYDPPITIKVSPKVRTFIRRIEIKPGQREVRDLEKKIDPEVQMMIDAGPNYPSEVFRDLLEVSDQLPEVIVWVPEFVSIAPVRADKSLSLKVKAAWGDELFRVDASFDSDFVRGLTTLMTPLNRRLCFHATPYGPNWTYLPLYDLALMRHRDFAKSSLGDEWAGRIPNKMVWVPDFMSQTGSSIYARDREPNDLDVVFRAQETEGGMTLSLGRSLSLKIHRVLQRPINWNSSEFEEVKHTPIWDLCLVRKGDLAPQIVEEPEFAALLYKEVGAPAEEHQESYGDVEPEFTTSLSRVREMALDPIFATTSAELLKASALVLMQLSPDKRAELREDLAALEHEQWATWAEAVLDEVGSDRQERWQPYFVPYEELSESVKDDDREWADEVLTILHRFLPEIAVKGMGAPNGSVEKAQESPSEDGSYRYVLQHHWRGKSCHTDLRCEVNGHLRGWTLLDQIAGKTKEPVETLAQAKTEDARDIFKIDWGKGEIKRREARRAQIRVIPKPGQIPSDWLSVEGATDRTDPGESPVVGATQKYPGVFHIIGGGAVEYGASKPSFIELWLSDGKLRSGRWLLRHIERKNLEADDLADETKVLPPGKPGEGSYWTLIQPEEEQRWSPYVLSKRAIDQGWLPPKGRSALPKSVRSRVPEGLRYWTMERKKALEARRQLADTEMSGGPK